MCLVKCIHTHTCIAQTTQYTPPHIHYTTPYIQLIIRTIPTVVLFEDGVAKGKIIGFDGLTEGLPGTCVCTCLQQYTQTIIYWIVIYRTILCTYSKKVMHTMCVCLSCVLYYEHQILYLHCNTLCLLNLTILCIIYCTILHVYYTIFMFILRIM